MKAVVVTGLNAYGVEDIETLPPQANEVRVQMKACGLCLSDHHVITRAIPTPLPCVLGHEGAGVIAEVGAAAGLHLEADGRVAQLVLPLLHALEVVAGELGPFHATGGVTVEAREPLSRLADADLVKKAMENKADEINTCIACNQACLDHTFTLQISSCLVNPRACHETLLNYEPTKNKKKVAVVGAGPGGLAAALGAARAGADPSVPRRSRRPAGPCPSRCPPVRA